MKRVQISGDFIISDKQFKLLKKIFEESKTKDGNSWNWQDYKR